MGGGAIGNIPSATLDSSGGSGKSKTYEGSVASVADGEVVPVVVGALDADRATDGLDRSILDQLVYSRITPVNAVAQVLQLPESVGRLVALWALVAWVAVEVHDDELSVLWVADGWRGGDCPADDGLEACWVVLEIASQWRAFGLFVREDGRVVRVRDDTGVEGSAGRVEGAAVLSVDPEGRAVVGVLLSLEDDIVALA